VPHGMTRGSQMLSIAGRNTGSRRSVASGCAMRGQGTRTLHGLEGPLDFSLSSRLRRGNASTEQIEAPFFSVAKSDAIIQCFPVRFGSGISWG